MTADQIIAANLADQIAALTLMNEPAADVETLHRVALNVMHLDALAAS